MSVSLVGQLRQTPFAFVDVETTGASPERGDRVIELGVLRVEGGRVVRELQRLVDPKRPISPSITRLTGITPEMCDGQCEFADVRESMVELLRGAVIVGHNVPFDLGFLRNECRRSGLDLAKALPGAIVVDTVRLARRQLGRGGNALQKLAARFGCTDPTAHRALADCLTTYRVFEKLIEGLGGWDIMVADLIQAQGGVLRLEAPSSGSRGSLPLGLEPALERKLPIELEYVDAANQRSVRVVTPVEVRKFRGELILLAWCAQSQGRRSFKLNRIVRLSSPAHLDPDTQLETPAVSDSAS